MNHLLKLGVFLVAFGGMHSANAQFFKKLKDRAKDAAERTFERKIEEKTEQKTNQAIDSIFSIGKNKKKRNKNKEEKEEAVQITSNASEDFGDAIISGPNHPKLTINTLGKTTASITASQTVISASWWTHNADIPDGFRLVIGEAIYPDNFLKTEYTGHLELFYDSSMPIDTPEDENGRVRAVTENYAEELITSAKITFVSFTNGEIKFKYSGDGFNGGIRITNPIIKKMEDTANNESNNSSYSEPNAPELKPSKPGFYQFNYQIETLVISADGESYPISYVLNNQADYFGMKADMSAYGEGDVEGSSTIIMENGATRIFVDTPMMKMQMSQNLADGQTKQMPQVGNYNYSKPTKTGNTKSILNYTCHEYVVEQDGGKVMFWAAPDVAIPNWMFGSKDAVEQTGVLGFVLEFTAISKEGKTISKVTAINDNYNLEINASDYKKMF